MLKVTKKLFLLVFSIAFVVGLCSCGRKASASSSDYYDEYEYAVEAEAMPMPTMAAAPMRMSAKSTAMAEDAMVAGGMENGSQYAQEERKLIKTGSISFEVENLDSTEGLVTEWAEQYGGYVFSSGRDTMNAWYTVKIPSSSFDEAMNSVGTIGSVKSRSVSTEDVSDSYYDLKTRLETRKIMRDRLSEYLEKAENIDNLLKIESQLNSVISDIEYMEGNMKRLNGRIDYSTININVSLPYRTNNEGEFTWPDFDDSTRKFFSEVVDFFGGLLSVVLYMIICGVPTVALIIFLYWFLFGKLGLLIRIFKKVSRPRQPKAPKAPKDEV
ncbi:MAG: DUF4349 domain-containing protein [Treponemataceae bacterium]|nr:DUF4349 domain-containing protein [Treponemataceae bacterium]